MDPSGATAARYTEAIGRPAHVPTVGPQPRWPAPHFMRASRARPRHLTAAAHRALAESAQPCAVMPSTTSRSPPTEIPLRMRCVRFSGWSWERSGTGAPWGLGRRTPGVVRVVQVCLRTGCSGWISVCGCFTWDMSAAVSVPAPASASVPVPVSASVSAPASASVSAPVSVLPLLLLLRLLLRRLLCWLPSGSATGPRIELRCWTRLMGLPSSDDAGCVRTIAGRRDDRAARVGIGSARGGGGRRGPVLVGAVVGRQRRGGVGAPAAHAG